MRDSRNGSHAIAHFYRDVKVWPRLNPTVVLAPSSRPLASTIHKSLFMGGDGRVKLTASIHRLHWVAGQQCPVSISVVNESKKTIKSATITLVRTTTILGGQTSTFVKSVATSTLEMGHSTARGHASAKGWWLGVRPEDQSSFSHFILIPVGAVVPFCH